MKKLILPVAALCLGACATNEEDDRLSSAIDDFIVVSELEEAPMIRSYQQFEHRVLNDRYVLVYTKKEQYLLAYSRRCRVNYNMPRRPDRRSDPYTIRAGSETFRGCRIDKLYPLTGPQAIELADIGKAPGEG